MGEKAERLGVDRVIATKEWKGGVGANTDDMPLVFIQVHGDDADFEEDVPCSVALVLFPEEAASVVANLAEVTIKAGAGKELLRELALKSINLESQN